MGLKTYAQHGRASGMEKAHSGSRRPRSVTGTQRGGCCSQEDVAVEGLGLRAGLRWICGL